MRIKELNLLFLSLMELCAGLSRGSFLVCIGWTTLVVTDDVAIVGQVFIAAMLTNLISAPFLGVVVDRYNRKTLAMAAHFVIAASMAAVGVALAVVQDLSVFWIFVTIIVVNLARALYQGAHDGLIHANVGADAMVRVVARFRTLHLTMTAIGTVLVGVAIEASSPAMGFLFSAATSALLVVFVAFVKGIRTKENASGLAGFLADFQGGLQVFRDTPMVRVMTVLAGVALPIGQLSNAILSSYIRDDLGRGSDVFGLVDAAWPVGGMAAAAVLSLGLRHLSARGAEFVFSALVGVATIAFALCETVVALAILHGAMGFSGWLCRIVIQSRILQICTAETVGRTRVYIDMMFSASAMIMCLSPTLISLPETRQYFLFWGAVGVVGTLIAFIWQKNNMTAQGSPLEKRREPV